MKREESTLSGLVLFVYLEFELPAYNPAGPFHFRLNRE